MRERCIAMFLAHHPGWEVRIWDNATQAEIVGPVCKCMLPIHVSDIARFMVLEMLGGCYIDHDIETYAPFPILDDPGDMLILSRRLGGPNTSIVACRAGNNLAAMVARYLRTRLSSDKSGNVIQVTGHIAVQSALRGSMEKVVILGPRDYSDVLENPPPEGCVPAFHHLSVGSWLGLRGPHPGFFDTL